MEPKPLFVELRELIVAAESGAQVDVGPFGARIDEQVAQTEQLAAAIDELDGDGAGDKRDQVAYLLGLYGIYEDAVDALERGDLDGARRSQSQIHTSSFVHAAQEDPDRLIEVLEKTSEALKRRPGRGES